MMESESESNVEGEAAMDISGGEVESQVSQISREVTPDPVTDSDPTAYRSATLVNHLDYFYAPRSPTESEFDIQDEDAEDPPRTPPVTLADLEENSNLSEAANSVATIATSSEFDTNAASTADADGNTADPDPEEAEAEKSSRKRSLNEDETDEDGMLCPICLDNWTSVGEHRICALRCGHLFGYKCVTRWLASQYKKTCPTCKKRVGRGDLRYIYAKKLIAVDTTEVENMKKQLEMALEEKNKVLFDLSRSKLTEQELNIEILKLRQTIYELSHRQGSSMALHPAMQNRCPSNIVKLYKDKTLEVCKQSGCRVIGASCERDLLVASMKSPSPLFAGYGLRKINISYYKPLSFIPVHSQQIRDVCFHPQEMWVLSAAMDKTCKVIDLTTNATIHTLSHQMPLWSCCWDVETAHCLYVGTQSGSVLKYDVRNTREPLTNLFVVGDMSPVVAVASIPRKPGDDLASGGIISCKLNSLWFFENKEGYVKHALPLEGPYVSMKYDQHTGQLLVSSRPNGRFSYSRHTVCTLQKTEDKVTCNTLHCFQGGGMQKLLSKSCFLARQDLYNKGDYVAAYQESSKCVYLWSINNGQRVASVPAHDAVLDLCGIENHNGNFLISLTEKKLDFYKFA